MRNQEINAHMRTAIEMEAIAQVVKQINYVSTHLESQSDDVLRCS